MAITKCIKIAISFTSDNSIDKKTFFNELRDIQYKTYLACNRAMTYQYTNDMQNLIQKDIGIPNDIDKDVYGKSLQAWVENRMNEIMYGCLTSNIAQTRIFAFKRYGDDKKRGLLKGNVTLSQFKRDMPIMIHNKAYKIIDTPKGYGAEIGLFNTAKQKELGVKRIKVLFPNLGSSEKTIIKRIYDKTYKLGAGQLTYNQKKKKWLLTIPYTFEKEEKQELNPNLIMGIDLGVVKVATFSIYNVEKQDYISMYFKDRTIDGAELIHHRQKIEARRKELGISSKWSSDNNTGRGYKIKMEKSNKIGDKYNRFKETYNHKVSRYIVDIAIKYNVSLIQMENLTGFSEEQENSLLKNWSYYDLQEKIRYKAKEHGIEINLINPQYTSQRCSCCGNIDKDNRPTQEKFKCTICNHTENADINASKNISIPDIENIINDYIK